MNGATVLDIDKILKDNEDQLACAIAEHWMEWHQARSGAMDKWEEITRYVTATDTSTTTNSSLPWKNKTTIPKLCQIRDNLFANYMATMFPKRKWMIWEGEGKIDETAKKKKAIEDYTFWAVDRNNFKKDIERALYDFIDTGNCFAMPVWESTENVDDNGRPVAGYVGPAIRRISPYDIVFNPLASSFEKSPKIIRSILSLGECKSLVERLNKDADAEKNEELWDYMKDLRYHASQYPTEDNRKETMLAVDGFGTFYEYLDSDYVEILTFYGDIYDEENDEFLRNYEITIADRHKIISKRPNPSFFPYPPIFHAGWRKRSDNLWAMGPLENLVGMQYRIDHLENLKADVFDLIAFPPIKIKGYVEDFEWGPMARIVTGDDGDVELLSPDVQALNANLEIANLMALMEEMAGAPKEAMGFRTPGEKTKYEVQRLENAANRIFQNKISLFEEELIEPLLNGMLEIARRNMSSTSIRVFNDDEQVAQFKELSKEDITGNGRLRPVAARHFVEKAETVQNLTQFFTSPLGQMPAVQQHFSGIELAKLMADLLEVKDRQLVQPYIALTEMADAQRIMNTNEEMVGMEAGTPSGLTPDDYDA